MKELVGYSCKFSKNKKWTLKISNGLFTSGRTTSPCFPLLVFLPHQTLGIIRFQIKTHRILSLANILTNFLKSCL